MKPHRYAYVYPQTFLKISIAMMSPKCYQLARLLVAGATCL